MVDPRFALFCLLAASLCAACSGSPNGNGAQAGGELIPACAWPAVADTFDAVSGTGCSPRSMLEICEVPGGSLVRADGSIAIPDGGVVSCNDHCPATQYALSCYGTGPDKIPSPPSQLGCSVIPIPTPSTALFYCCRCSR